MGQAMKSMLDAIGQAFKSMLDAIGQALKLMTGCNRSGFETNAGRYRSGFETNAGRYYRSGFGRRPGASIHTSDPSRSSIPLVLNNKQFPNLERLR